MKKKILVIEDEHNDFQNVKYILNENFTDLDIIKISDTQLDRIKKGEKIIDYLNNDNFSLIILDVGLNEVNGLEADTIGKSLYNYFPENLKRITLFVSQTDANNLTREMKRKFFIKSNLDTNIKFVELISNLLSITRKEHPKEIKNSKKNKRQFRVSDFITFSSLLLMLTVILYTLIFLILKIKYMLDGHYKTEDIVHFVESFFLVALPIFMCYAIFIFAKKIVGAIADGRKPEKGTISDSVKIIGMVKNLFIGSIISYISLSIITNLFVVNLKISIYQYLVALGVIITLVIYWRILSKH